MTKTKSDERKQFLIDVFTTALEGGIGYWSAAKSYHWSNTDGTEDFDGFYSDIVDFEDENKKYRIDQAVIVKGVNAILKGTPEDLQLHQSYIIRISGASRFNDAGEIDALDADIIVQVGLFGKVVYG